MRSGSMTARQPFPKGANARIHEVKDGKRNHQTSPLCEVFCFKVKVTSNDQIKIQKRINQVGRFEAIASHPKNNVAKMPAGALLLM